MKANREEICSMPMHDQFALLMPVMASLTFTITPLLM